MTKRVQGDKRVQVHEGGTGSRRGYRVTKRVQGHEEDKGSRRGYKVAKGYRIRNRVQGHEYGTGSRRGYRITKRVKTYDRVGVDMVSATGIACRFSDTTARKGTELQQSPCRSSTVWETQDAYKDRHEQEVTTTATAAVAASHAKPSPNQSLDPRETGGYRTLCSPSRLTVSTANSTPSRSS